MMVESFGETSEYIAQEDGEETKGGGEKAEGGRQNA